MYFMHRLVPLAILYGVCLQVYARSEQATVQGQGHPKSSNDKQPEPQGNAWQNKQNDTTHPKKSITHTEQFPFGKPVFSLTDGTVDHQVSNGKSQVHITTEATPVALPVYGSTNHTDSDEEPDAISVIFDRSQLVMTIIGFFANMATVITLVVHGKGFSPAILILLRHQSLIDAWICLMGAVMLVQPYMWLPGNNVSDIIVCHVWHSQTVYWTCVTISIYNLVAIAFERYIAVCHVFKHNRLNFKTVYWYILVIYIFNSAAVSPAYLQVHIEEDMCVSEYKVTGPAGERLFYAFAIYYFILFYAIPTILFFLLYGFVIKTFKHRQRQTNLASSQVIDQAATALTKTAVVVTVIFIIAMGYDFWYYLLGYTGIVEYKMNSPLQKIGVWLSAFNSVANPFVYAILMPVYTKSVKKTFCFFRQKYRSRPCVASSDNTITGTSSVDSQI